MNISKQVPVKRSGFVDFFIRLVKEKPMGTFGGIIVLILLLVGIFANFIAPEGFNVIHLMSRFQPPSAEHWFGTDQLGRDVLSRVIYGARISVIIGVGASTISTVIAGIIALFSGFLGWGSLTWRCRGLLMRGYAFLP